MITVAGKVRDVMGLDEELSIDDEQINTIIKIVEKRVLKDLFTYHYKETPDNNPDNGATWNSSNTRFQIGANIADSDFDESASDDVTGTWIDSDYAAQTCSITVNNARYGLVDIFQSDGSSAIPSTAQELHADYYTNDETISAIDLEEMGTLLACHFVQLRLTEPKKISLRDLENNARLIEISPTRFLKEYKELARNYKEAILMGT